MRSSTVRDCAAWPSWRRWRPACRWRSCCRPAASPPRPSTSRGLDELTAFAAKRIRAKRPAAGAGRAGARSSPASEPIGYVVALRASSNGLPAFAVDLGEVLRTAALAAITEVAVVDARDEVADEIRGTLLEDLRAGRVEARKRPPGSRLGCELIRGAVALVAEVRSSRPHYAAALISSEH